MISPKKFQVVQRVLFLSVVLVASYFFLVFQPLADRAASLDRPLLDAWKKLARTGCVTANAKGIDLATLEEQARWLEKLSTRLQAASQIITNRVAFAAGIREKIRAPFQLVEFQNERQLRIETIEEMASEKHVVLDAAATAGFPEYSAELKQPGLLWAELALVDHILETAVRSQLSSINNLSVRPLLSASSDENFPAAADELSVNVELTGPAPAVSRYLLGLAARADEAKVLGLPELPANKPALFIDRCLVRKNSASKPDSVKVELRVTALVYHE